MGGDVGDFRFRDVRAAGHVSRSRKQDGVIAEDPFLPVIGKEADILFAPQSQFLKGGGQLKALLIKRVKGDKLELFVSLPGAKGGNARKFDGGLLVEIGESGGRKAGHELRIADCETAIEDFQSG